MKALRTFIRFITWENILRLCLLIALAAPLGYGLRMEFSDDSVLQEKVVHYKGDGCYPQGTFRFLEEYFGVPYSTFKTGGVFGATLHTGPSYEEIRNDAENQMKSDFKYAEDNLRIGRISEKRAEAIKERARRTFEMNNQAFLKQEAEEERRYKDKPLPLEGVKENCREAVMLYNRAARSIFGAVFDTIFHPITEVQYLFKEHTFLFLGLIGSAVIFTSLFSLGSAFSSPALRYILRGGPAPALSATQMNGFLLMVVPTFGYLFWVIYDDMADAITGGILSFILIKVVLAVAQRNSGPEAVSLSEKDKMKRDLKLR